MTLLLCAMAYANTFVTDVWTTVDGLPQNTVTDLTIGSDGRLWIATLGGLAVFDGHRFETVPVTDGQGRPVLRFSAISRASDGELWLGTLGQGVLHGNGEHFESVLDVPGDVVRIDPFRDQMRVFVGARLHTCGRESCGPSAPALRREQPRASENWVYRSDLKQLRRRKGEGEVSVSRAVRTVLEHEGVLWVGLESGGLMRIRNVGFTRIDADGLGAYAVFYVHGSPWLWTSDHRLQRRGPEGLVPVLPQALLDVATDGHGRVWGVLGGVLGHVHPVGGFEPEELGLPVVAVAFGGSTRWVLAERDSRAVLLETRGGVTSEFEMPEEMLSSPSLVAGGARTLWISAGQSVWAFDGSLTRPTTDGVPLVEVRDALETEGSTWVGTYGQGLVRVRDGVGRSVTPAHGLCDSVVSRVLRVGDVLWMNSNRGVFQVPLSDLDAALDRGEMLECRLLGTGEGNGGGGTSGAGPDGTLWFPTVYGAAGVRTTGLAPTIPPVPRIVAVTADGVPVAPDGEVSSPSTISVRYAATDLVDPNPPRFRHRLLGLGDAWTVVGEQRSASWSELGAGAYTIEVQASANSGWGPTARRSFVVPQPLLRTWPFLAGGPFLIALASAGLMAIFASRRRRSLEREIESRSALEGELREREQRLVTLFDSTTDGLLVHDIQHRLVDANLAGKALLPAAGAVFPDDFVHGDDRDNYEGMLIAAMNGESPRVEIRLVGEDERQVLATARRITRSGQPHVLVTVTDITEERDAEMERERLHAQLRRVQNLESIGRLAGGVAHDFNNLLAIILGQVEILEVAHPESRHRLTPIENAARRGADLARKLLVFGRGQPAEQRVVDPRERVDATMELLRRLLPAEIGFEVTGAGPHISVDPGQLEQALVNLVVNARDAMADGGTVTIAIREIEIGEQTARQHGRAPGPYCQIAVKDPGVGIAPEVVDRLFEPFFTTRENAGGTGLGLTVVHGCVAGAGGFVTVESEIGRGSSFNIHIPATDLPLDPTDEAPSVSSLEGVVLMCDDDPDVLSVIGALGRRLGLDVLLEEDPRAVLALLRGDTVVHVLITDVSMPVMSGPQLAANAREIRPGLPVVFITGHAPGLSRGGFVGEGDPVLGKPFTSAEFAQALRPILKRALKRSEV